MILKDKIEIINFLFNIRYFIETNKFLNESEKLIFEKYYKEMLESFNLKENDINSVN